MAKLSVCMWWKRAVLAALCLERDAIECLQVCVGFNGGEDVGGGFFFPDFAIVGHAR